MLGAIGIFVILYILIIHFILGFFFTWIANAVAREDYGVPKGVGILIVTAIAHIVALAFLFEHIPSEAWWVTSNAIRFGILTVLTWFVCETTFKQAAIIAAVYTVLLQVVLAVLGMLMG